MTASLQHLIVCRALRSTNSKLATAVPELGGPAKQIPGRNYRDDHALINADYFASKRVSLPERSQWLCNDLPHLRAFLPLQWELARARAMCINCCAASARCRARSAPSPGETGRAPLLRRAA